MKSLVFIISLLFILVPLVHSKIEQVQLTDANFYDLVHKKEWLIVFSADWCQACMTFKSDLKKFADTFQSDDLRVGLINISENPGTTSRMMVFRIPAIYHYKNDELRVLESHRSYENLTNYFKNEEGNSIPPRASILGPFSSIGYIMTAIGILGFVAVKSFEHVKSNYPPFVLYAILISLVTFPILFIILVVKGERKKKGPSAASLAKKSGSSAASKKKD